jgi:hypothetical protein
MNMKLSDEAIQLAEAYLGKFEVTNNDAPWLRTLMQAGGNPANWKPGESYCIAALLSIFDMASSVLGVKFSVTPSAGTQTFYQNATGAHLTGPNPGVGDIVIFRLGDSWEGHAGLVAGLVKDANNNLNGIETIEFNTSDNVAGDQRNGGGCFRKVRLFANFKQTSLKKLWIRGYVKTSTL